MYIHIYIRIKRKYYAILSPTCYLEPLQRVFCATTRQIHQTFYILVVLPCLPFQLKTLRFLPFQKREEAPFTGMYSKVISVVHCQHKGTEKPKSFVPPTQPPFFFSHHLFPLHHSIHANASTKVDQRHIVPPASSI